MLKENGISLKGWEGAYFGDLPLEAGLSSSASLELVTALALSDESNHQPPQELALLSHRAENEVVGVNCGIMDQFASALSQEGCGLLLDCHTEDHQQVELSPLSSTAIIAHTGVTRKLSSSPYNQHRDECQKALEMVRSEYPEKVDLSQLDVPEWNEIKENLPQLYRNRIEHVIYENMRVKKAAEYARQADPKGFGDMMVGSHRSLRDLYEVSTTELDALQDISVKQSGVWGARMTGAGFGGCVVSLVDNSFVNDYLDRVPDEYLDRTGRKGRFYVTRPGRGMHQVEVSD